MRTTRIKAQKSYDKTRIAVYCRVSKDLETQEDRMKYQIACLILHMGEMRSHVS